MSRAAHRRQGAGLCRRRGGGRSGGAPPDGLNLASGGTFTRSTEGSYLTGAPTDGTAAFLAWAGVNVRRIEDRGDGLGAMLLMEGSRTNYIVQSRDASAAAWSAASAGTQNYNAGPGPDAAVLADECVVPAGGNKGQWQSPAGMPAGTKMTGSVWCRRVTGTGNAALGANGGAIVSTASIPITTTYQRIDLSNTSDGGGLDYYIPWDGLAAPSGPVAQAVDYLADLHQKEAGFFPSSVIRTLAAAVTRGADLLSYATGQYPASLIANGLRFTVAPICTDAELVAGGAATGCLFFAGTGDAIYMLVTGGVVKISVYAGGVLKAQSAAITFSRHQPIAISVSTNGTLIVSGATTGNGTTAGTPFTWGSTGTTIYIGSRNDGTDHAFARFSPTLVPL